MMSTLSMTLEVSFMSEIPGGVQSKNVNKVLNYLHTMLLTLSLCEFVNIHIQIMYDCTNMSPRILSPC